MFVDKDTYPETLFVITVTLGKGHDYARTFVVESQSDQDQADHERAVERARAYYRGGWDDVRLRRVRFKSLQDFERFERREEFDRYKLEDWSSDAEAY